MNRQVMRKEWGIFFIVFQIAFACSSAPAKKALEPIKSTVVEERIVIGNERLGRLPAINRE